MSQSAVGICNLAMAHLGDQAQISQISPPDGSAQAKWCSIFYPIALAKILTDHQWSFATKRVSLAAVDNDRDEWLYAYSLPSDNLKLLSLLRPEATDDAYSETFITEADENGKRVIYTNVDLATLRYIYLVNDTTRFTSLFVPALARLVASYVAGPLLMGDTGATVGEKHLKIYESFELPKAAAEDANNGYRRLSSDFIPKSIRARRGLTDVITDRVGYPYAR